MQCSTVQYNSAVQCSTVQYSAAHCSTVQYTDQEGPAPPAEIEEEKKYNFKPVSVIYTCQYNYDNNIIKYNDFRPEPKFFEKEYL